ncbi:MAG: 4-alpha-glucanotransferase [Anaerolineae bacterium]|nr:4-alpha-glucanotransferase [Anaerolineae bacterium]
MNFKRASGILLHPTSLPSQYGIGDLGPQAHAWVEISAAVGSTMWQVLPLGPTGFGDSPYQCLSSFAGNPYLISPDMLLADGLLDTNDLVNLPQFSQNSTDYGVIIPFKIRLFNQAYDNFQSRAPAALKTYFSDFLEKEAHWLDDFAIFMAIKDSQGGKSWSEWPLSYRIRATSAMQDFHNTHERDIDRHAFYQFLFFRQWGQLRAHAQQKGIQIVGDLPLFVAHDSADVWANPELFFLNDSGQPTVVAGVPPDYYSTTGQRWGNPIYRWEIHAENGYSWWLNRIRAVLRMVDVVRLDHFRGFAGYWEIPAEQDTAVIGRWVTAPGKNLFNKILKSLGELPFIAEDLGEITPDVIELRDRFQLPGMKILVFAFGDDGNHEFLPHNFPANSVVYTSTHDNDTVHGWYESIDSKTQDFTRQYLASDGSDIAWDLIRAAWSSAAVISIASMQDILRLGNEARMNYPGNAGGNWRWRMTEHDMFNDSWQKRLSQMNHLYRPPAAKETN